ncbi:rubrerythrin [Thermincola ferriacetica]|uniref:Rubrerythrin n=2 Tax=Thermincola TaxID=278993 RepID=D5XD73_THEPJ|nr:Rubrerythrin [Thermincola potens JR]KNZ69086.1 rubrerythrin [Thermincola ferriacetica]
MEFATKNEIGVTKGTAVEEAVDQNFRGETMEVGLYLAMARQAQREGYPEIAEVFKAIAMDEAWHAARFAELNGLISSSTKENVEKMLKGETMANKGKKEAAVKAKENNIDEAHDVFDESAKDEARHALALDGLLKRYFG